METKDRVIYIDNTAFEVDLNNQVLVQATKPENSIAISDLKDEGAFHSILLEKETKMPFHGIIDADQPNDEVVHVVIPRVLFEDSFWTDPALINHVNKLSFAREWSILVSDEKLQQRLAGVLPLIDIGGSDFIVDWRLKELRANDNPHIRIDLRNMEMDPAGENYGCLYDWKNRCVYPFDPNMTSLPENVTALEIPYELKLDPVGVASQYGMSDVAMLSQFPIQEQLIAKVIPLADTELPVIVRKNQLLANARKAKEAQADSQKRSRGKRL